MFSELIIKDLSLERKKFAVQLMKDFVYESKEYKITVRAGFIYDMASIPLIFQNIISKVGPYDFAATVHDWLYSSQALEKGECDRIFREAMKESGVWFLQRWTMWAAVRLFSFFIYRACRKDAAMYKRIGMVEKK